ncbi:MAG: RNA 3'-phosphate cyclase [Deltaproteobacteria bacterium]|nr:RNA 3'-phosphate cyclase [Deltaproteobacteria bacterium]
MRSLIEIDGSFGEGGGQMLRTALTLSCVLGRPFRIFNIRKNRREPGLKPQHLAAIKAATAITGAKALGAHIGSSELAFGPETIRPGVYSFDVAEERGSAGSALLVFQTVSIPLLFCETPSRVSVRGGTHVPWAPVADFIKEVYLPALSRFGASIDFKCPLAGFYPAGGGVIEWRSEPSGALSPVNLPGRGAMLRLTVTSSVSNLPDEIARRQLKSASVRLKGYPVEGRVISTPSPGQGTFIFILAEFENIRAGFSALGARGKRAEVVGNEAAEAFLKYMESGSPIDKHLADQILIPMALARGPSAMTVEEVSGHLETNIHVIEKFLPVRFDIDGRTVSIEGAGVGRGG